MHCIVEQQGLMQQGLMQQGLMQQGLMQQGLTQTQQSANSSYTQYKTYMHGSRKFC